MRMPVRLTLFSIMLVDVIGVGIVLPILPKYLKDFGITGWSVGAMVCSYSLMQFFLAPLWGRLSDAIGRRPILMAGMTGSSISYVLFAIGARQEGTPGILLILLLPHLCWGFGVTLSVAAASIAEDWARRDATVPMPIETFVRNPPWSGSVHQAPRAGSGAEPSRAGDATTDTGSETNPGRTSGSGLSEKTGNESSTAETRQPATA